MAKVKVEASNYESTLTVSVKGSEEYCREMADRVLKKNAQTMQQAATVPCATLAEQPPVWDVMLKDGEAVQIMQIGVRGELRQFILVDCLAERYAMNNEDTSKGGYEARELREKLNGEIIDRFPDELRAAMVPFENGDLLRLPSREELFGDEDGNKPFDCMERAGNRVAGIGKNGDAGWYWLSSVAYSTGFCYVGGGGNVYANGASYVGGVRPRFQIR